MSSFRVCSPARAFPYRPEHTSSSKQAKNARQPAISPSMLAILFQPSFWTSSQKARLRSTINDGCTDRGKISKRHEPPADREEDRAT